ncbi:DNA topoisomerase IV subunit A [Tetragenococcus koreensis]|uniref:DNA topoisomerase 4 subunit A n=2 Tax=Tetragenococcus koreensis TaxID=290335 RepID=A0AAN4RJM9_9ENTE|nr:DNA topoisomerase IV subunit A [Tetragenococcus koreensis]AYW45183.1 DNA topoisomerase IV subunit A [Tetragenococcus koreensis]MCF1585494.1 DNA topoisomerase IV subunit A [Tetragenococcus koreensis]MCF1615014.1 DNA topoisomerase IV subunit A [Tetragenococcus koreensis]MCF1617290.1 DNA topoisomerase IV subunit A [Tetragenococcus koreensis]MCF1622258.1 DNA topoisomerase IV subunit A [Tetragenococcus koreensis]
MEQNSHIQELTLEEVMGDRFGRYSKYIIQERALPDVRDGLKPVQRRILFSMNNDGNTHDKSFRKSAKSVGNVMGNYHPHGDSSIYEAMVRMSQDWKLRDVLIEMHGNNGSMDGDPPAAMRYTEARLSELSGQMLTDIEKDTVDMVLNFDDTEKEPTVLPAKFPNLLVNGSTGISAGYATEIPTHNLAEVIDGTVYLIDHPNASLDKLMEFIPGPDFPTGGILQGKEEIKKAYETGKGKVILRSKTEFETLRGGKQQIVVTEVPYEVNKASLVKKIDEIRLAKKIEGIAEVRDETDRTGLRMVIELKKDVNAQGVLNYLFKNTELQVNYSFNMVAIDHMRPRQVNLKHILESYVEHRRDVILKRSQFELNKAQKRQHIVDGLMKALSILDKVIATIRASKDKKDAKNNLVIQHQFTQAQAEAIVNLQLYRLTNTDITELEKEAEELAAYIAELQKILNDDAELLRVIKKELRQVKKKFSTPRLTRIEDQIEEIKIETEVLVPSEDVVAAITREGYIKRSSLRSFSASKPEEVGMKDTDEIVFCQQLNTLDHLLLVTNKGNIIYRPIFELPDLRWKDTGEHLSQTILNFSSGETILAVYSYSELDPAKNFVLMTKKGMIKQTRMDEFKPWRTYKSRAVTAMKFKEETDELVNVYLIDPTEELDVFLATYKGMGLRYALAEVPVVGSKASGVKAINLKADDEVASGLLVYSYGDNPVVIVTQRGGVKRMLAQELSQLSRAKRGVMILRELKKNPHRIIYIGDGQEKTLILTNEKGQQVEIQSNHYPISDRTSNGSFALDEKQGGKVLQVQEKFEYQIEE